jgi:arylesterase / paraoxonase
MRQVWLSLGALVAAAAGWFFYHFIPASGAFADLEPKLAGDCRRVEVAPGTEDVTIDPDLNIAFVSAADRRAWFNGDGAQPMNPRNGIYALSLDGSDAVRRVSPEMENFHPHGISLWRGADGQKRLFVVNHPAGGPEAVEIFDVGAESDLVHLESVSFEAMRSPNDVLGVGPHQFYATNDQRFETGVMATLEPYFALPVTDAVYYDGETGRSIAGGLTYANGINISADGSTVYIAELLKRRIGVYTRDAKTGALKRVRTLSVDTAPDNIEVSRDGALWIAGHPKIFEFVDHAEDANVIAPSQVIRLDPDGESKPVFVALDGEINAASVGAAWDNTLIVGAVFDGHVMVCPMMEILLRGPTAEHNAG